MSYRPIRDYGIIGDMRTAALVSSQGSIDWCCLPRFDSPSVFARLLDDGDGGHFSVAPVSDYGAEHAYEEGTNVLTTRFTTAEGELVLTDFMPAMEWDRQLASHQEIHRHLHVPTGRVDVEVDFRPRFDYARLSPRFVRRKHGVLATDERDEVLTISGVPGDAWDVEEGDAARAHLTMTAGDEWRLVLRYDDDEVWPSEEYRSGKILEETRRFWRGWSSELAYEGPHRDLVRRSALALKLLFYAPTGAVVAAPTTSLPEAIGGERNWDYRYTWLRDSTYTLFGLYALGKFEEMDRYMVYLKKVCRLESDYLQILFGVGGERSFPEVELAHLEGYRGSTPVRIGNAAAGQFQLDVYGEIMDSIRIWRRKHRMTEGMWALCRRLADEVCERWREPDHGVWEVRDRRRHFVFSKVMGWVALDRAIEIAEDLGLDGNVERWRAERQTIRDDVLERGWSEARGTFTQSYESDRVDASNLVLPLVGFLPADDPRIRGTVDRIVEDLQHAESGLLRRYEQDWLEGEEGAFWVATFQLAQVLALAGQVERAEEVFRRAVKNTNGLGLFSEEVDPETGELLGNYPQAFTHIGLINAAHVLAEARKKSESGRPRSGAAT